LQGSAATDLRGGGSLPAFRTVFIWNQQCKSLWKLVNIYQSYCKNRTGLLFETKYTFCTQYWIKM